jgi:hypothetical protein
MDLGFYPHRLDKLNVECVRRKGESESKSERVGANLNKLNMGTIC